MKKFLLKVILFFGCVVVMDFTLGFVFSWLRSHAKGGSTANCEYIANRSTDDIIILGSSRATHHYIPHIIEDSLGMSCYNCGEEGNGVVLAYGRLKMLTNRYKPKLVLYEVTPGFDYGTAESGAKYLGYLRSYYDKDGISEIFDDFDDELSWLKMKSKMYQNTGRLLPDIADNLVFRNNNKGYDALYGQMKNPSNKSAKDNIEEMGVDSLKLSYMGKVIILCKQNQIPLYFMISPRYGIQELDDSVFEPGISLKPALALCEEYDIPVYNYVHCPPISGNIEYFQDKGHMNNQGAVAYTQLLIKEVLNKNNYK